MNHRRVKIVHPGDKAFRRRFQHRLPRLNEWLRVSWLLARDRRQFLSQGDLFRRLHDAARGPTNIEIETLNRCNGTCGFCPVNRSDDPRAMVRMEDSLFRRIIDDLAEREYGSRLFLHSNNEPFLDKRIFAFAAYARARLPGAWLGLYSNGSLLGPQQVERILPYLSSLVINNYSNELTLHDNVREIVSHLETKRPDLTPRLTVRLRWLDEFKTNRSGHAPNRELVTPVYRSRCAHPYFQMVIRPDGKVSLCCYDATGDVTLGDVSKQGVWGAWIDNRRQEVCRSMLAGRDHLDKCRHCDNLGWSRPGLVARALKEPGMMDRGSARSP